jgi:FAD/FMN-containing dehydrogenase
MEAALAGDRMRVRSANELCHALRHAGTGSHLDASALDRVLRLDAAQGLVEVQAGATWSALARAVRPGAPELACGWDEPESRGAVIGRSIDANTPGPDGRPAISHVEAIALVTPDGELRRASRACSPELFALAVGGQGLFGVAYSVTLRLDSLTRAALAAAPPRRLVPVHHAPRAKRLELLVPPERLERLIDEARGRCAEWRISMQPLEARAVLPEGESFLPWARREYAALTLALEEPVALGGCVRAMQLRRELIDLAIAHGGSFPIARSPDATRAQVEACYPELKRFLAEKRRYDPGERLVNGWYRHHRRLLGRHESREVRWGR